MPVLNGLKLIDERVAAIRTMHDRLGNMVAQLDVSGGIDSGVMLGLLARAVGPENITAVYSSIHSGTEFLERARLCARAFDVSLVELDLTRLFEDLTGMMRASLEAAGRDVDEVDRRIESDRATLGSLRSGLRAPIGRGYNRLMGGGIRHGTGNECEDRFLRFYQKGGDGEVDTNPIAMLAKGEVYQLARAIGVPRPLIDAIPSPDLHGVGDVHNDEDELHALTGVRWTYSRINFETGEYSRVGTIERMSRLLDAGFEEALLGPTRPEGASLAQIVDGAQAFFPECSASEIEGLLNSCRVLEAGTRHKANPNIPSLGNRVELIRAGLLTDALPI